MGFTNIVTLLGGIALFLFGMSAMGDSLKALAGNKMETYLYKLSSTPLKGFLLGVVVASIIQSSSATSVMVVSFINAGMMAFGQGLCVTLGSCVGTTMTSWILSISGAKGAIGEYLSVEVLYSVFVLCGVLLRITVKKQKEKNIGMVLVGLGTLLLAMHLISNSVDPLANDPNFTNILIQFEHNPILGILAGLLVAAVVQSCSAAIGILQAVSLTCAISLNACLPIILGMNIGASVPVLFSMMGASKDGKRCSIGYLVFNVLGTALICALYYPLNGVFHFEIMNMAAKESAIAIPIINTLMRIVSCAVLVPLHKLLEKVIYLMFPVDPSEKADQEAIDNLNESILSFAPAALEKSTIAVDKMCELAKDNLFRSISLVKSYDNQNFTLVQEKEEVIDKYEDKLGNYVVRISENPLNTKQQASVASLLAAIGDFERLSDHAVNISETAQEMHDKKLVFSPAAQKEMDTLVAACEEIISLSYEAFMYQDIMKAYLIEPLEEVIDELTVTLKANHIDRLSKNECTILLGFVFNDLLTNLERISDHCANIGFNVLHKNNKTNEEHDYSITISNSEEYQSEIAEYRKKYALS